MDQSQAEGQCRAASGTQLSEEKKKTIITLIKFKYRNNLYTLNKNGDNTASKIVFTLGLNHTRECTKIPPHHLTQSSFESRTFQHSPRILIYSLIKILKINNILFYPTIDAIKSHSKMGRKSVGILGRHCF